MIPPSLIYPSPEALRECLEIVLQINRGLLDGKLENYVPTLVYYEQVGEVNSHQGKTPLSQNIATFPNWNSDMGEEILRVTGHMLGRRTAMVAMAFFTHEAWGVRDDAHKLYKQRAQVVDQPGHREILLTEGRSVGRQKAFAYIDVLRTAEAKMVAGAQNVGDPERKSGHDIRSHSRYMDNFFYGYERGLEQASAQVN